MGRLPWSLADYAPESGLLLDLESARERDRIGSKLEARARPLCVRALEWRADGDCSDNVCRVGVALNERLTIQLFLLTRPTGGMFAVVFCCVFLLVSIVFFFLFESRASSGFSSSVLVFPGAAAEVAQQQGCSSCSSSSSCCHSSFHHAPEISGSGFCWIWIFFCTPAIRNLKKESGGSVC